MSHDRDFLDRTVERVVELDEWTHQATEFIGGWSEYEQARARALRRQTEAYGAYEGEKTRLEEQLRRMQRWEERGYGQGRKKKKTKDVKKSIGGRIQRLGAVDKPYEPWELRLELTPQGRSGDVVVRLERAVVERSTFRLGPLDLELSWADRLAIVGPNGSGKTTLISLALRLYDVSNGAVLIDGVDVRGLTLESLERAMTVVFQSSWSCSPAKGARAVRPPTSFSRGWRRRNL